jgi:hypothetical protein
MTAAQRTLTNRLSEIELTLKHMRRSSRACKCDFFKHPDLANVLYDKYHIEMALKQLALLPKNVPDISALLYMYKINLSREISTPEPDAETQTFEQFN